LVSDESTTDGAVWLEGHFVEIGQSGKGVHNNIQSEMIKNDDGLDISQAALRRSEKGSVQESGSVDVFII